MIRQRSLWHHLLRVITLSLRVVRRWVSAAFPTRAAASIGLDWAKAGKDAVFLCCFGVPSRYTSGRLRVHTISYDQPLAAAELEAKCSARFASAFEAGQAMQAALSVPEPGFWGLFCVLPLAFGRRRHKAISA
jgi:hypothetical protein